MTILCEANGTRQNYATINSKFRYTTKKITNLEKEFINSIHLSPASLNDQKLYPYTKTSCLLDKINYVIKDVYSRADRSPLEVLEIILEESNSNANTVLYLNTESLDLINKYSIFLKISNIKNVKYDKLKNYVFKDSEIKDPFILLHKNFTNLNFPYEIFMKIYSSEVFS